MLITRFHRRVLFKDWKKLGWFKIQTVTVILSYIYFLLVWDYNDPVH